MLLLVRLFLFELVIVRGNTMAPSILEGDVLLIQAQPEVALGDVVLIEQGERRVLRRVLASEGQRIASLDGLLLIDDLPLEVHVEEPFAYREAERTLRQQSFMEPLGPKLKHHILGDHLGSAKPWVMELPELTVPPGHLFLLCDNRRSCPLDKLSGVVPKAWISGRVKDLLWQGEARIQPSAEP